MLSSLDLRGDSRPLKGAGVTELLRRARPLSAVIGRPAKFRGFSYRDSPGFESPAIAAHPLRHGYGRKGGLRRDGLFLLCLQRNVKPHSMKRRGGQFPEQARMAKLTIDQHCRHAEPADLTSADGTRVSSPEARLAGGRLFLGSSVSPLPRSVAAGRRPPASHTFSAIYYGIDRPKFQKICSKGGRAPFRRRKRPGLPGARAKSD